MMESSGGSSPAMAETKAQGSTQETPRWRRFFGRKSSDQEDANEESPYRAQSTLGILSDKQTDEVPGR